MRARHPPDALYLQEDALQPFAIAGDLVERPVGGTDDRVREHVVFADADDAAQRRMGTFSPKCRSATESSFSGVRVCQHRALAAWPSTTSLGGGRAALFACKG